MRLGVFWSRCRPLAEQKQIVAKLGVLLEAKLAVADTMVGELGLIAVEGILTIHDG